MQKHDISTRADIEKIVTEFYRRVALDGQLAPFFEQVNWGKHLPIMVSFWENTLFLTGGYQGNPMVVHSKLHERMPFHASDFKAWQLLFIQTVDDLFEGQRAEHIKSRAMSMATVMQLKILHGN